jgi:hypothetical protein
MSKILFAVALIGLASASAYAKMSIPAQEGKWEECSKKYPNGGIDWWHCMHNG